MIKRYRIILLTITFIAGLVLIPRAVSAEEAVYKDGMKGQQVTIYYFYFTPRCDECLILEEGLNRVLDGDFPRELKDNRLIFKKINLSDPDPESKEIIRELRVRRQLLLLVSGETKVNLTRDAFRYVEKQYDQFHKIMKDAIKQALSHETTGV